MLVKVGRRRETGDRGGGRGRAEVSRPTQGRIQVGCRVPELVHLDSGVLGMYS